MIAAHTCLHTKPSIHTSTQPCSTPTVLTAYREQRPTEGERSLQPIFHGKEKHEQHWMNGALNTPAGFSIDFWRASVWAQHTSVSDSRCGCYYSRSQEGKCCLHCREQCETCSTPQSSEEEKGRTFQSLVCYALSTFTQWPLQALLQLFDSSPAALQVEPEFHINKETSTYIRAQRASFCSDRHQNRNLQPATEQVHCHSQKDIKHNSQNNMTVTPTSKLDLHRTLEVWLA